QLAVLHAVQLFGQLGIPSSVLARPCEPTIAHFLAAPANAAAEVVVDAVRNVELGILRPAVTALGQTVFFLTQRFTVSSAAVLLVRRAVSDMAVHDDQRWTVMCVEKGAKGLPEHAEVVGIPDAGDIPAVADEARGYVIGESQRRTALDGDVVVVVDPAEIGEFQVAGQRGCLGRDAFHHAAIATQGVDVEIDQVLEPRPVEVGSHPPPRNGHADAGGPAVAQGAGRAFSAAGPTILRVAGAATVQLPEALDRLQRHRRLT